jgi:hypothetical protein
VTWNASTTRRAEVTPGDVGCGYHEVSHVGFFGLLLFDLKAVRDSLPRRGVKWTLRRTAEKLGLARPDARLAARRSEHIAEESLGLVAGDWVQVKSADEIRETLDARGMVRGLRFMDEMWKYCGGRFRVLKRMERLLVERTGTMRNLKDTVLLEGTTCDGSAHEGCDATCQHLWRELWLRRVDRPTADG